MTKGKRQTQPRMIGPKTKRATKRANRRKVLRVRRTPPSGLKQRAIAQAYTGLNKCALAIALPEAHPNVRLPTVDMPRSSVTTLRDTEVVPTPANTSSLNDFDLGTLLYAHYGQPARLALVTRMHLTTAYYKAKFNNGSGAWSNMWKLSKQSFSLAGKYVMEDMWPFVGATWDSGPSIHGPTLPYGASAHGSFCFLNAYDSLKVTWPGQGAGTYVLTFTILQYDAPGVTPTVGGTTTLQITQAGGSVNSSFTPTVPGYYALKVDSFEVVTGTFSSGFGVIVELICMPSASVPKWANVCMGDIDPLNAGDTNMSECTRVNSSSFLMTNTTSALNKQGTAIAARIREHFPFLITPTVLGRMAEKYVNEAAFGIYSFKEFDSAAEQFRNNAEDGHLSFDLDYDGYYHFVAISNPASATASNVYSLSIDTTLEYKTDVARYPKDISYMQHGDLIEARRLLNSNPHWFYENPLHMGQIYGFVKNLGRKAVRGAITAAPYALDAASVIDPQRAPLYKALRNLRL